MRIHSQNWKETWLIELIEQIGRLRLFESIRKSHSFLFNSGIYFVSDILYWSPLTTHKRTSMVTAIVRGNMNGPVFMASCEYILTPRWVLSIRIWDCLNPLFHRQWATICPGKVSDIPVENEQHHPWYWFRTVWPRFLLQGTHAWSLMNGKAKSLIRSKNLWVMDEFWPMIRGEKKIIMHEFSL